MTVLLGNTTTCGWSYTEFLHAAEAYLLWPDVTLQICSVYFVWICTNDATIMEGNYYWMFSNLIDDTNVQAMSMKTCLYGLDILFLSPMSDMQDYKKPYPGRSHELFLVTLLLLLGWVSEEFYYCLGGWCSKCTTTATTRPCNYTKQSHLSSYPNTSFCYMLAFAIWAIS